MYHLHFSLRAASPETFGYTLVEGIIFKMKAERRMDLVQVAIQWLVT
jgi:hypothetical protein